MKIHVWVQNYAPAAGGILTFSRFLVRALGELYPEADICVFSKNDRQRQLDVVDGEGAVSSTRGARAPRRVGFGEWPAFVRAAAFALGLVRSIRRERPDLVISTHVNFAPVASVLRRFVATRFCAVGHGIEVWEIPKASLRRALCGADCLIAVSDFTRRRMASALSISADRIELLPNTFDAEKFQIRTKPRHLLERYGLKATQPVILTVARLEATEQYKGYDKVLRALPAVRRQIPDAHYLLVGDGPDRKRIEALSRELGVEDAVTFAGSIPNDTLSDHYNTCDVFAMPSKGEGFGIVFLEALGCGKPVIAGNKDGSVEAVLSGKLGVLVDPDDQDQIATALVKILSSNARLEDGRRKMEDGRKENSKRSTLNVQRSTFNEEQSGEPKSAVRSDVRHPTSDICSLDPETLRREVIEAYGYPRFVERLREIIGKMF